MNKIKQGYKQTVVGVIPEDWEVKSLKSQVSVDKENLNSTFSDEYINYVSLSDINNGKIYPKKIRFKEAPSRAKRITKKGDVLLATVRPNLKNFAIVDKENIIASTGFAVLGYKKMDLVYLYNFLYSHFAEKQYFALTVGSNYPALNSNDVKNLKLPIPPLPEQKAIADCLSTWDKGIENLSALIASKKEQKKGLMQQLLTGNKRLDGFTEEWKEVRLKDISIKKASSVQASSLVENSGKYNVYGASGFLTKVDHFDEEHPYIGIVKDGSGVGNMYLLEGKSSVLGTLDKILPKNSNLVFLYSLLKRFSFDKYKVGGAIPHIYYKDYSKEKVFIPSMDEQNAIAEVLSNADREIELLESKLETFKVQKKGLMQVLLTGEKRLV